MDTHSIHLYTHTCNIHMYTIHTLYTCTQYNTIHMYTHYIHVRASPIHHIQTTHHTHTYSYIGTHHTHTLYTCTHTVSTTSNTYTHYTHTLHTAHTPTHTHYQLLHILEDSTSDCTDRIFLRFFENIPISVMVCTLVEANALVTPLSVPQIRN